jgi:hypothetical protein
VKAIEISDELYQRAEELAAQRGLPVPELVSEMLEEHLTTSYVASGKASGPNESYPADKPWMQGFGGLRDIHEENLRVQKLIDEEFGQVEPEDWR